MNYPNGLKQGDKVALISPARFVHKEAVERAAAKIEALGYKAVIHTQNYENHSAFAGTDEQRLDAIHKAFLDPEIKAIWCMRGGYGCSRLLERIDYTIIKKNPKIFIGSSDVTALLAAFYTQGALIGHHGPMQMTFELNSLEIAENALKDTLEQPFAPIKLEGVNIINGAGSTTRGKLIGGNLHLLQTLIGTAYQPDFNNALLYIEDTHEPTYALERILYQFKHAGIFDQISGLMVAKTEGLTDYKHGFDFSEQDIFGQFVAHRDIPYIFNVPCGHGGRMLSIPFGAQAKLDLSNQPLIEIIRP